MNGFPAARWVPRVLGLLRIVAGLIVLAHGTQKLLGFPKAQFSPEFLSLPWIAGVLELVGESLLILGLFTRPVAFVLSGQMTVAYWMVHAPQSPFPVVNGGDGAILYCFVFLFLVFARTGPWNLDAVLGQETASGAKA